MLLSETHVDELNVDYLTSIKSVNDHAGVYRLNGEGFLTKTWVRGPMCDLSRPATLNLKLGLTSNLTEVFCFGFRMELVHTEPADK